MMNYLRVATAKDVLLDLKGWKKNGAAYDQSKLNTHGVLEFDIELLALIDAY